MRWGLFAAILTVVAGCTQPSPPMRKAAETVAELRKQAREFDPARPCRTPRYDRGSWVAGWGIECEPLYPAEVIHGVWYLGFEERSFIRDVDSVPLYRVLDEAGLQRADETELHIDVDEALRRMNITELPPGTAAIAITFVGRRAEPYRVPSGHRNQAILVDAVLTGRLLGRVITRLDLPGCEGNCAEPR